MRYVLAAILLAGLFVVLIAGPRGRRTENRPIEIFPDMDRQAKVKYQTESRFFADGRGARPPVAGTVPMGYQIPPEPGAAKPEEIAADIRSPFGEYSRGTDYLNTGRMGAVWGTGIPFPVTRDVLERGRERYQISCAVCHGATGAGNGQVANFWSGAPIANLLDDRIRQLPDGQIFDVITHGKGVPPNWTMFPYGDKLTVEDRWAVIAWVRTLERSQRATVADLTPEEKAKLQ
jgi:mono/diheme cytochrome c family protein